jgi:osmotically-inducible protein OsmY/ribosomal protein L40E
MICGKCNAIIPDTAKFCPKCGTMAESTKESDMQTKKCPQCGTENPLTAKFCRKDGTPLKEGIKQFQEEKHDIPSEPIIAPQEENAPVAIQVETNPEESIPVEEPKAGIICPRCGTLNPPDVKFCEEDGIPLKEGVLPLGKTETQIKHETPVSFNNGEIPLLDAGVKEKDSKIKSKFWLWAVVVLLTGIIAGAGSFLYFYGALVKDPIKLQERINNELREKGLMSVSVEVNQDWVSTIKGTVSSQTYKDEALNIARKYGEIKAVIDNVIIQRPLLDIEQDINNALKGEGIEGIYVWMDKDMTVILKGTANSYDEKERAIRIIRNFREIKDIKETEITITEPENPLASIPAYTPPQVLTPLPDTSGGAGINSPPPRISAASLEIEINSAFRNSGLRGVTATVDQDMGVALKGTVESQADKDRAFDMAKPFTRKGAKRIKDMIFVMN